MQQLVWEGDTRYGHYQVVDGMYDGRPARVLYSGNRQAAQSGIATDNDSNLLFEYNQRFMELAEAVRPKTVAVIGGGVGTLPKALLEHLPDVQIDVVEPDTVLTKLAYNFFDLPVDERLRIVASDGRSFLREQSKRYDLLVVDAFHHTTIPIELKTIEAFQAYAAHLEPAGLLLVNVISAYHGPRTHPLQQMCGAALRVFHQVDLFVVARGYSLWLPQNFIITAQNTQRVLNDYTRGTPIEPPEIQPSSVLHDKKLG